MTDQEVYDDILTRLCTTRAITPEVVGELLDLSKRLIGEIESQKMGIEGMKAYCEIRDSNMQPLLDEVSKLSSKLKQVEYLVSFEENVRPLLNVLAGSWINALNWHTDEDGREWLLVDPEPVQKYLEGQKE